MFLKSLELENVRCFEHLFVDFDLPGGSNRKWSVILGENGTGKSTLLRSLALVLAGSDALSELLGNPADWIRIGSSEARITAKIENKSGQERELAITIGEKDTISDIISRSHGSLEKLDEALEHTNRSYFVVGYGSTRRLGTKGLSRVSSFYDHPRARSVSTLFSKAAELNPLESWAMRLDYRSGGSDFNIITNVLSDFLPELTFSHIDKEKERLLFKTLDGEIPLDQLSDGYQNMAGWVGDMLYQISEIFDDYKEPLHTRGVLIIDEVDLHLHPVWQRKLLEFLDSRLPNMQIVVTTHSVVTAQQSETGSLHYLIRRDDKIEIEDFVGDPSKLLINQLLMTEAFGNSSDESLSTERMKNRYRSLHSKSDRSGSDNQEMEEIKQAMSTIAPEGETDVYLTDAQRRILKEIQSTYDQQKP